MTDNRDVDWSEFDPEAYFQHYFGEPHPDDDRVVQAACAALAQAEPRNAPLDVVDVGTGPNLFPLLAALPRVARLTAWEFASPNLAWLKTELAAEALRPQFRHFWNVARAAWTGGEALPDDPLPLLREKAELRQGSIFDLPERRWDAATMFFCAESITDRRDEFEAACRSFARCVKPGGTLAAAFLAGSSGYAFAERPFPALNISDGDVLEVFTALGADCRTERIGIVENEVRSGYTGMIFLRAVAA